MKISNASVHDVRALNDGLIETASISNGAMLDKRLCLTPGPGAAVTVSALPERGESGTIDAMIAPHATSATSACLSANMCYSGS